MMGLKNFLDNGVIDDLDIVEIFPQELLESPILSQYDYQNRDIKKFQLPKNLQKVFDKIDTLCYAELRENLDGYDTNKPINVLRDMLANKLILESPNTTLMRVANNAVSKIQGPASDGLNKAAATGKAIMAKTTQSTTPTKPDDAKEIRSAAKVPGTNKVAITGGKKGSNDPKDEETLVVDPNNPNDPNTALFAQKFIKSPGGQ